jgi:hypothetical protein
MLTPSMTAALDECALVDAGVELERGHRDVATHRHTVHDGPVRWPDLADEELSQSQRVGDEPVRPISPAPVARRRPRVSLSDEVRPERRGVHAALPGALAFVAVSKHD